MNSKSFYQRIILILLMMTLVIVGLSAYIITASLKVKSTNLRDIVRPTEMKEILIEFNKNVATKDIESRLTITPDIPGIKKWSGKMLHIIPENTLPYEKTFQISIAPGAQATDGKIMKNGFSKTFKTSQLQFIYLGTEGSEKNQLVLMPSRKTLTDGSLIIEQFSVCPDGTCVYLLAYQKQQQINRRREVYRIDLDSGRSTQVTKDSNYQNTYFNLSPDGSLIGITRYSVAKNTTSLPEASMWIASTENYRFTKITKDKTSGPPLFITPDNQYLLYQNADSAFALMNLKSPDTKDSIYIGTYIGAFGFHPEKPQMLILKDVKRDALSINNALIVYNSDGRQELLTQENGVFNRGAFTPDGKGIITTFAEDALAFQDVYVFHLKYYDLKTKTLTTLTNETDFSDESPSISEDNNSIAFLRYDVLEPTVENNPLFRLLSSSLSENIPGGEVHLLDRGTGNITNFHIKAKAIKMVP